MNTEIPPLGQWSFYAFLGLLSVMEPDTEELMREVNERSWREDVHDSPHEDPWHTALHASQYPGDDPLACPRYLAYRMMNFPPTESMPPWVTTTGSVGSAGEADIVRAWHEGGRILSAGPDERFQTRFEDREYWLTGSPDLVILKPGWHKGHVIESKCKADDVIEAMLRRERRWDKAHRRQLLATLGLAHDHDWGSVIVCGETWRRPIAVDDPAMVRKSAGAGGKRLVCREHGDGNCLIQIELEPPDTGSIYYWSRSWPRKTVEYFFEHDPVFMERGLEVLRTVREHFERDEIPPRPLGFAWSKKPCRYCDMKRNTCRIDDKRGTTILSESAGVAFAESVRGDYDVEATRQAVFDRWGEEVAT